MDNFALDSQKSGRERLLSDRTHVVGLVRLFLENQSHGWWNSVGPKFLKIPDNWGNMHCMHVTCARTHLWIVSVRFLLYYGRERLLLKSQMRMSITCEKRIFPYPHLNNLDISFSIQVWNCDRNDGGLNPELLGGSPSFYTTTPRSNLKIWVLKCQYL